MVGCRGRRGCAKKGLQVESEGRTVICWPPFTRGLKSSAPLTLFAVLAQFLALDFHLASQATEIQSNALSSFIRPIVQRSVCIHRIRWLESEEDGVSAALCPRWRFTFARQLPFFLDTGPFAHLYYACIESQLMNTHPCKNTSSQGCRTRLVDALG